MTAQELVWRIAGGSGDGIDSTSQNFAKALLRSGLDVFTHRHYPSRIRGGHTYVEVRARPEPVRSRGDGYNFLLVLGDSFARNKREGTIYGDERVKPLTENLDELREGGVVVYDTGMLDEELVAATDLEERAEANDWHVYPVDLQAIAREHGRDVMRNTAGVGVTAALIEKDLDHFERLLEERMSGDVLEANRAVLRDAYEQAEAFEFGHDLRVPSGDHEEEQALLSGSHAIAYGALDEGCRFISGYPMTPWTEVFTLLSKHLPERGGIAEQVEDEIAAVAAAIGASHAGAKAMSGSSGGGFALMSEALGLAEITETPLVLVESMRAGPSTGMPTKPEQSDLDLVLYTSQGDSNRVVFAPSNTREAYEQTRDAFELAYEYHLPALVIYDQKLSGELRNVPVSFFDQEPSPGLPNTLTEDALDAEPTDGRFHRYRHEDEEASTGVSRRSIPGQRGGHYLASGNEHHPTGHLSEDPENRVAQVDRRAAKLDAIRERVDGGPASHQTYFGPETAEYGIVTWGSQQGTVREAVARLNEEGHSVRGVGVSDLAPFPVTEMTEFLESVESALVVEMSESAQFRGLVQRELGAYGDRLDSLLKYNGDPFEPREIAEAFRASVEDHEFDSSTTTFVPATSD
ncbi:2-oxoacid:acceptor oxidoreductase subunit alpha [Salinirubellus salinus]|uniref:2-oxoglutarate synthase subunit KorA n=1 Tax=Salinirubellus salinus TaxID=1364945 RepID=A0A9E7U9N9_9EURY|nr:2-oxoacid:acceptor oxidoreductase subunit alpha [Salinirubellus salinus]UWM53403.1 2-oxoacid:acceptor oxidoreductase subunit alpha [Salinirubellus salinus]